MSHDELFLLYGGGLDSTGLLFYLLDDQPHRKITLVHIDYGQTAVSSERAAARYYAKKYNTKTAWLKADFSYSSAHIMKHSLGRADKDNKNRLELRNPALITLAASYAASVCSSGSTGILALGFHFEPEGAPFPDARIDFIPALEQSLNLASTVPLRLITPFSSWSRLEILKYAVGKDDSILTKSHTCYQVKPCGVCTHCRQRHYMMKELGIE